MLIEFGNPSPHDGDPSKPLVGPVVTSSYVPDGVYTLEPGADVRDLALHIASAPNGITQLPDHSLFVHIVHDQGVWGSGLHSSGNPSWVHCESAEEPDKAAELERLLSEFYKCPRGRPADVEDTHYTRNGPPGVGA